MAENNIAVQKANAAPKLLLNGVEATAQQVVDAFMAGPVRLVMSNGYVVSPTGFYWENSDGTQTNPKAITYAEIQYVFYSDSGPVNEYFTMGTKYVK